MQGVREDGGRVSVGEIEELQWDAFLVGGAAQGGEQHVDQARVARPFGEAAVLERREWHGGIAHGRRDDGGLGLRLRLGLRGLGDRCG